MQKNKIYLLFIFLIISSVSAQSFFNLETKIDFEKDLKDYANTESVKLETKISEIQKNELTNKIEKEIQKNKRAEIIVWLKEDSNVDKVLKSLEDFNLKHRYITSNGFAGTISKKDFDSLKNNPKINYIVLDEKVEAHLPQSRNIIHANTTEINYNLTGNKIGVCVIDTGINYTHPNLDIIGGYDFVNNDPDPLDDNGHGTAVAGVIASDHPTNRGIAVNSNLVAVKVLNSAATGFTSTVAAGIDWCVTNKNIYNISIISMSLGTVGVTYTPSTSPLYYEPSLINAYNNNIAIVASAGNDGSTTGLSYPAVSSYVISVGATWDAAFTTNQTFINGPFSCSELPYADKVTCYTNRAPFLNLMAPGSRITTTNGGTTFSNRAGTSFAAPHISGVIAQMLERNKQLTPSMIKAILISNSDTVTDNLTNNTFPRVNSLKAIRAVPYLTKTGNFTSNSILNFLMHSPLDSSSTHILALSFGTIPGTNWVDGRTIPMNFDDLLLLSINAPQTIGLSNTFGSLDSNGEANATLTIPYLPGIENVEIYAGFVAINQTGSLTAISNAVRL